MKRLVLAVLVASLGVAVLPALAQQPATPPPIVSRAELVKALVDGTPVLKNKLMAFEANMPPLPLFYDVPQNNSLAPYIEAAFDQGIVTGNEERLFRPTQPVTNEEVAVLDARLVALADPSASAGLAESVPGEPWYLRSQNILTAHGIQTHDLGQGKAATRNDIAQMTNQALAYVASTAPTTIASEPATQTATQPAQAPSPAGTSVPSYLPIRLNPLPQPTQSGATGAQTVNGVSPQIAAVVATSQIAAAGGTEIASAQGLPTTDITAQGTNTQIYAPITTGGTSAQVSAGQSGGEINAGSNGTTTIASSGGGNAQIIQSSGGTGEINAGSSITNEQATDFTITLPALGIGPLKVTNPDDPFTHDGLLVPLKQGVGHLFGNPGGGGKILIYGHSSSYPWDVSPYTKIFRQINKLNPGDEVDIEFNGQQYKYTVTYEQVVAATDMSAYQDDGTGEDLILYTCWPPDNITQRYLVHAKPM